MPSSSDSFEVPKTQFDGSELKTRLTWIAVFRVLANTVLLAFLAIRQALDPHEISRSDSLAFGVIGAVYLLTLAYSVVLRRGLAGSRFAYVQVFGDVVLATSVVFLTGGGESPFTFVYSIAVIAAAILLQQTGALVAATASTMAFSILLLLFQVQWLQEPAGAQVLSAPRLTFLLVSHAAAQFLIAGLSSYLTRQVAVAGGRIVARDARIQQLVGIQNMIVAAMPSGLVTYDGQGRVTFVNPAAETILGRINGDWPAQIEELLPGVLKLKQGTRRAELSVPTPSGERVLGLAVAPLAEAAGATLVVFQDLTELRRTAEQLRMADHLASLGKLSAQLAHEIRNPLASMRGAAQMLGNEVGKSDAGARLSRILIRESDRLSALVEDFLRFARPPPPKLEPIDLGRLVADTVEVLRADPLAIGVNLEAVLVSVHGKGDAAQLQQVLINLIRNALVAVGQGGTVKVTVQLREGKPEIHVWDSAGKIPPADLSRIFEPFYTTRAGGTGLGLSTAYTIVRSHGGQISVRSAPATGTEFVVALPSVERGEGASPGR